MAEDLKISKSWYHSGRKPHYDIPKLRIKEIQAKCTIIDSRELVHIIKSEILLNTKVFMLKSEELGNYKFKVKISNNFASSEFSIHDMISGYLENEWSDTTWIIRDILENNYIIVSPTHIKYKLPNYFKHTISPWYIQKYY
jgi:hypothetical protein